jgi:hypothetical protein
MTLALLALGPVGCRAGPTPDPRVPATGARTEPATTAAPQPARLEANRPLTREIAAGERHAYSVALKANQALHIAAIQLGADIVVTLRRTDGEPILEMDTPTGNQGVESVWFVAPTAGDFEVEVRSLETGGGRYELRASIEDATPADLKRAEVHARFTEAFRHASQGTPEEQKAAIGQLGEVAALARGVGEREIAAFSIDAIVRVDTGAGLESLGLPSFAGKVPVYYSPGYEARAAKLRDRAAKAVGFFERRLGVTPKIYVALVTQEHWSALGNYPYGTPFSRVSRSGSGLVCFAATPDQFDELGKVARSRVPEAAVKRIESAGVSFQERWRDFGDSRVYHELGHIYSIAYGIAIPNRWVGELLANYLLVAYTSEHRDPQFVRFQDIAFATLLESLAPEHPSLEDFERRYLGVGRSIGWYQAQLVRRAAEVYPKKKLEFLKEVKAAFPPDEKRPVPVDVSLERLEKISPGFLDWAKRLESSR